MKIINGTAASAVIFDTNNEHSVDDYALSQLQHLCDNDVFKGCNIRIMPDVHPGKVGTIGFTSTLGESIMPNVIGVDIGCGMTLAKLNGSIKDFGKLDNVIRKNVPSGMSVRNTIHSKAKDFDLYTLYCYEHIKENYALLSLGTLGSGNHFIEVDKDDDNNYYLVVHSGSRHLGHEVTDYYLKAGQKELKSKGIAVPFELTYLTDELIERYLHDLAIVQDFAALNRDIIINEICKGMKIKINDMYSCIHNYVDFSFHTPIIRKGAISARKDEQVIIPVNMRDGIILGHGLGNKEWNYSAPHGAGRILRRDMVKSKYTLSSFKKAMNGIYSTCISKETLDEAPFAYRNIDDIVNVIGETVVIDKVIKPVYNFKAYCRLRGL